jgi:glycosyltransferase involved in cell wall biosynthesis
MLKPEALKIKKTKKRLFLFLARFTKLYKGITWHATSPLEAEEIETYFGTSKIHVARNLSRISTAEIPKPNKRSGELKLLTVARISEEKGILEAAEFLSTYPIQETIHWRIVGFIQDPELAKTCLELLEGTRVTVEFMGHLDTPSIRKEYSKAHVFYLPTRGENYGHAIAEALAGGMPVIISNRTPWRNLKESHVGADLPLEEKHFHDTLQRYHFMEEEHWLEHCRNARQFAIKHVNSPEILAENLSLFKEKN